MKFQVKASRQRYIIMSFFFVYILIFGRISLSLSASPCFRPIETIPIEPLEKRIPPPEGYHRVDVENGSFAYWLRFLPLKPEDARVKHFDGLVKKNQEGVFAVIDIDVGDRDLQQCADAVIRLRAEYLFSSKNESMISFDFTSGDSARWVDWRAGLRPIVSKKKVVWKRQCKPDSSYSSFRKYLETVFTYAGSLSLSRQLRSIDPVKLTSGDVFIQGGFPGHAVLVGDVAEDSEGRKVFLLLQSYMPAQDVHILRNPANPESPWYPALEQGELITPDWKFNFTDLKRFPNESR